ncbi:MAG: hypothetical protein ACK5XN_19730, partial [Bacteroidota bacterium]
YRLRPNAATNVMSGTLAPRFAAICLATTPHDTVEILSEPAFVYIPALTDIKRFSRYWQVAKQYVL